jgi:hypothetical protein
MEYRDILSVQRLGFLQNASLEKSGLFFHIESILNIPMSFFHKSRDLLFIEGHDSLQD